MGNSIGLLALSLFKPDYSFLGGDPRRPVEGFLGWVMPIPSFATRSGTFSGRETKNLDEFSAIATNPWDDPTVHAALRFPWPGVIADQQAMPVRQWAQKPTDRP
eukprot:149002-Pyramimonas_sp.AAC.1